MRGCCSRGPRPPAPPGSGPRRTPGRRPASLLRGTGTGTRPWPGWARWTECTPGGSSSAPWRTTRWQSPARTQAHRHGQGGMILNACGCRCKGGGEEGVGGWAGGSGVACVGDRGRKAEHTAGCSSKWTPNVGVWVGAEPRRANRGPRACRYKKPRPKGDAASSPSSPSREGRGSKHVSGMGSRRRAGTPAQSLATGALSSWKRSCDGGTPGAAWAYIRRQYRKHGNAAGATPILQAGSLELLRIAWRDTRGGGGKRDRIREYTHTRARSPAARSTQPPSPSPSPLAPTPKYTGRTRVLHLAASCWVTGWPCSRSAPVGAMGITTARNDRKNDENVEKHCRAPRTKWGGGEWGGRGRATRWATPHMPPQGCGSPQHSPPLLYKNGASLHNHDAVATPLRVPTRACAPHGTPWRPRRQTGPGSRSAAW
jgi:hypothetical protein